MLSLRRITHLIDRTNKCCVAHVACGMTVDRLELYRRDFLSLQFVVPDPRQAGAYFFGGDASIGRFVDGGPITGIAGVDGNWGSADGIGSKASFTCPTDALLHSTRSDQLIVVDCNSHTLRMIDLPSRAVSTIAGGGRAVMAFPRKAVWSDQPNVLFVTTQNGLCRFDIVSGVLSSVELSELLKPGFGLMRVARSGVSALVITTHQPPNRVCAIWPETGRVERLAGDNPQSVTGSNGDALSVASFGEAAGVWVDQVREIVFVVDQGTHSLRCLTAPSHIFSAS